MKTVSIEQAKKQLFALARAAEAGERVIITENGEPALELVPHEKESSLDSERSGQS